MLQGPFRIWEGAVWRERMRYRVGLGQVQTSKAEADTWVRYQPRLLLATPQSCVYLPPNLACPHGAGMPQAGGSLCRRFLSVPSLGRATRHNQVPETTRPKGQENGVHAAPAPSPPVPGPWLLPLPRAPTSTAHLIFCSHFAELHKERTQHGGLVLWVWFLFVYLI